MKSILFVTLTWATCLAGLNPIFGQNQKLVSTYLLAQHNRTLHDRTKGNNPSGVGLGLQTVFNNKIKLKLMIDLTGDLYLENDKVARLNHDGTIADDVRSLVNVLAGPSFHPTQNIYVSLLGGPSFINGETRVGLKPSFGFYFSESQRWVGKLSYIHIFNRDEATKEDFSSLSFAIGFKLFQ
jgi:hypothetical protein